MTAPPSIEEVGRLDRIISHLTTSQIAMLTCEPAHDLDLAAIDRPVIARQLHDMGLTYIDLSPIGRSLRARILATRNHLIGETR